MNARLMVAFLALASSTGCIIVGTGGGPTLRSGDVTFSWSFAGASCNTASSVKSVRISIPGQSLMNAGVYPCLVAEYPGVVLKDFAGGSYSFTIEAIGYRNEVLYAGSGTFTVDRGTRVDIDLTPVGGPTSYAYLNWKFPSLQGAPNPDCAMAGVANVLVSIDNAAPTTVACNLGWNTNPGVQTPFLSAGTHSIDLTAVDSTGYAFFRASSTLTTTSGAPSTSEYTLVWAVGGTAVKWSITDGSVAQTCGQAGITDVYVNFVDAQGNLVYGSAGDKHACNLTGVEYSYLKPGTYGVRIIAAGTGNRVFQSNYSAAPVVTVVAGQFSGMNAAVNVQMFRTQ